MAGPRPGRMPRLRPPAPPLVRLGVVSCFARCPSWLVVYLFDYPAPSALGRGQASDLYYKPSPVSIGTASSWLLHLRCEAKNRGRSLASAEYDQKLSPRVSMTHAPRLAHVWPASSAIPYVYKGTAIRALQGGRGEGVACSHNQPSMVDGRPPQIWLRRRRPWLGRRTRSGWSSARTPSPGGRGAGAPRAASAVQTGSLARCR